MIRLQCDCGRQIAAPEQWLGRRVKCPQCARPVVVRRPDEAALEATAERSEANVESPVGAESDHLESLASPPQAATEAVATEIDSTPAPVPVSVEIPSSSNGEAHDSPAAAPDAAQVSASEAESPSKPEADRPPVPRPAPPRRLLAPAPPVNAVLHVPIPQEDDRTEYDPRRLPRFLGAMALLIGIAAAVAFWYPTVKVWAVPAAGAALALAAIGFSVGMSRHGLGIWIPLLALIVSGAALSVPWLTRGRMAAGPSDSVRVGSDEDDSAEAVKSRRILTVGSVRPAGKIDGTAVDLQFKLTNTSGRAISAVYGTLKLYDKDHRLLDLLILNINQPLGPKAAFEGVNTWTLHDRTRAALEDNKFTAEYRANTVLYTDGSQDDFAK